MTTSEIEWTDATWNPVTGCTKVSPGCANCYAERFANRLKSMLDENNQYEEVVNEGRWTGEITLVESALEKPYSWRKKRRVFVNSMSDLCHEKVPEEFVKKVFQVMNDCSKHMFQLLTKRPERMAQFSDVLNWTDNIWAGTSVESGDFTDRIDELREVEANIRFLSLEPLLGPFNELDLQGIDWVIVGGESGPGARRMESDWVIDIFKTCKEQDVPFFFKQWGAYGPDGKKRSKKKNGRKLLGEEWNEYPDELETSEA